MEKKCLQLKKKDMTEEEKKDTLEKYKMEVQKDKKKLIDDEIATLKKCNRINLSSDLPTTIEDSKFFYLEAIRVLGVKP